MVWVKLVGGVLNLNLMQFAEQLICNSLLTMQRKKLGVRGIKNAMHHENKRIHSLDREWGGGEGTTSYFLQKELIDDDS